MTTHHMRRRKNPVREGFFNERLRTGLYAPAAVLGLDFAGPDTDDLDALILLEDGDGVLTGLEVVLYSVRRGSAVIGAFDSLLGLPIEEGDVLTLPTAAGAFPAIFIPAEALGLGTLRSGSTAFTFGDELDALDLQGVPEPCKLPARLLGLADVRRILASANAILT